MDTSRKGEPKKTARKLCTRLGPYWKIFAISKALEKSYSLQESIDKFQLQKITKNFEIFSFLIMVGIRKKVFV